MLGYGSVCKEKLLKPYKWRVKSLTHPIPSNVHNCWPEHQYLYLEQLTQRRGAIMDLYEQLQQKERWNPKRLSIEMSSASSRLAIGSSRIWKGAYRGKEATVHLLHHSTVTLRETPECTQTISSSHFSLFTFVLYNKILMNLAPLCRVRIDQGTRYRAENEEPAWQAF